MEKKSKKDGLDGIRSGWNNSSSTKNHQHEILDRNGVAAALMLRGKVKLLVPPSLVFHATLVSSTNVRFGPFFPLAQNSRTHAHFWAVSLECPRRPIFSEESDGNSLS